MSHVMDTLMATSSAMQPGKRGHKTCFCSGVIQETKGHYAWILPHFEINHKDAWKHRGSVYLDPADICAGSKLQKNDIVEFFLYADEHGIGAEACRLKSSGVTQRAAPPCSADAAPLWLLDDSDDEHEDEDSDDSDDEQFHAGVASTTSAANAVVASSAPLWLLDDSDDDDSDIEEEGYVFKQLNSYRFLPIDSDKTSACGSSSVKGKGVADSDATSCGSSSRSSSPSRATVESSDSSEEDDFLQDLRAARAQTRRLATELGSAGLSVVDMASEMPSKGSALHASGKCSPCSFFPTGRCTNGKSCSFCHMTHDLRQQKRKACMCKASRLEASIVAKASVPTIAKALLLQVLGPPPGLEASALEADAAEVAAAWA